MKDNSMKRMAVFIICFCVVSTLTWGNELPDSFKKYWPQWHGPLATGVAPYAKPPLEWNENKNVRWKVEISGRGHSSPIVWDDIIFVTTAIETDKQIDLQETEKNEQQLPEWRRRVGVKSEKVQNFVIFAFDRRDGGILWQRTVREELPHEGTHAEGSWASNSPVTDGEHVYADFGSRGLYCFDMQGNRKWDKDFGDMTTKLSFGEGNSPVLYGNMIVINWDHEGQSFIIALDKNTGEEVWKVDRDETTSWATPIVVEHDGKLQVITSATKRIRSYDLITGKLIWECAGMTMNTIPSPVYGDGMVYATSGFQGNALLAIRLADAKGDITDSEAIVWKHDKNTPYVPSPLLYGDLLYFLEHNRGVLSCFNVKTGKAHYVRQKLENIKDTFVSPVAAGERVYITGNNGVTLVIKHSPTFEVLAENSLDDNFTASPAIVDNEIYLRGHKYLYCIAQD
jgi:outer membrane protein assembly factor BamB